MTKYAQEYEKAADRIRQEAEILAQLEENKICPECGGEGFLESYNGHPNADRPITKDCPACKGTGVV